MYYKKSILLTILFIIAGIVSVSCGDGGSTAEPEKTFEPKPSTWGKIISDQPQVFATSDVDQSLIDLNNKWYNIAVDAWGNYGPVELYIIGTNEQAAKTLEDDFCDRHKKLDSRWRDWDCANDRYKIFTNYVEEGGAAVSDFRRDYIDYHFMMLIMASKYPFPDEEDYKKTVLHEYFHVYQHAHIEDIQIGDDQSVRRAKQGGEGKPWFAEGTAEYMAQLLYLRQSGIDPDYVKNLMGSFYYSDINGYLSSGKNLKELSYNDSISAPNVGTWFIAYLVHQFGEETVRVDFYQDLNSLGFEGSFKKHFNQSSDDLIDEFDLFIAGGEEKALEIIP